MSKPVTGMYSVLKALLEQSADRPMWQATIPLQRSRSPEADLVTAGESCE
jgi:hypothetical protein